MKTVALVLAVLGPMGAARGEGKEPSKKTRKAVETLKEDLSTFRVMVYSWPPIDRSGTLESVRLAVDPKKVTAGTARVFPLTEKQAVALIDYLAAEGMFDKTYVPPPGFPAPGWFVSVAGGKVPAGEKTGPITQWWYGPEVRPADVGVIQHLTKALDGDAKAALEGFRKEEKPKK